MRRKKRLYRVVVTWTGGRQTEELVDALDWKDAERLVRSCARGADSIRAFLVLGVSR